MTDFVRCPNCSILMKQLHLERSDGGGIAIDLCFHCRVIWFDSMESPQLAAGAVMDLLRTIRREGNGQRQILREQLECPRCGSLLVCTDDLVRGGRIRYFRCQRDGGRITPFLQFLIEKRFVRVVTSREIKRLRLDIRQATCSACGAPIDLLQRDHCEYCHAPIAVLDADAAERAAQSWSERAERRTDGRAIAKRTLARLRNVEQWHVSEGGDLLLESIGILGG